MSIDQAVRSVVKEEVDEAMTTIIDEKVQKTVVDLTVDNLDDALTDKVEAEVSSQLDDLDLEDKVQPIVEGMIENIDPDSIDAAWSSHDHDGSYAEEDHDHYDMATESYVDEHITDAIDEHINEHHQGQVATGNNVDGVALNKHIQAITAVIGMTTNVDGSINVANVDGATTQASIPAHTKSLGYRLSGVEKDLAKITAWAKHVEKVLKAAASSEVLT